MESRLSIEGRHIATRGHSQDRIIPGQSRCSLLPDSDLCFYLEDKGQYDRDAPQKVGKALCQWTPLSEKREEKILFDPIVRNNFPSKMKSTRCPADPDWQPPVDIAECEDEFIIKVELPGIRHDQVCVRLDGSIITISGRREPETEGQTFQKVERRYGTFTRSFTVPESTIRDEIKADYRNGLLRVHLPKDPAGKTRSIDVAFEPVAR